MKVLGAILAGGASRRFGSDKAEALIDGEPMLFHVAHRLAAQTDGLVICGRSWGSLRTVADRPRPGMGPLGGLAGAIRQDRKSGGKGKGVSGRLGLGGRWLIKKKK